MYEKTVLGRNNRLTILAHHIKRICERKTLFDLPNIELSVSEA